MREIFLVMTAAMALAGCSSSGATQAESGPPRETTRCEDIVSLANDPWATPVEQQMLIELGRNEGCFGTPQPQRIDLTVRQGD